MKAIIKMAFAVAPLLFVSCDNDVKQPAAMPAGDGDDVQFTVPSALESRTMYSDDWDPETKKQDIYWGNYIAAEKDSIKIFCKNTVNNTVAVYQVEHGTNSNTAVDITKTGDKAMQWGGKEQTYNFYAFYPARQAGNNFLNGTDNTIRATVATGQSPTSYRAEIGGKNGKVVTSLQEVLNNGTQSTANQTVIYGQPDMSAAIMYAKTSTEAKDGYTLAEYGQPVPLNFNVLADVIDITLNGPVTPNNLGGNATTPEKADFINVQTVTLEAIDPATKERVDNKIISGNFDLNMETGEISNLSGNATIQLQLSSSENGKQIYPTMYVRAATEKPVAGDIDQIRLRAFLIPGQIKNLNELQIRVMTNCGEYTQALGDDDFNTVSGKIYPVRLGYFHNRGLAFDFSKWIGQLDPNIYISELSIPGAWHASNTNYQGAAANDLQAQYNAGVRAFEVHTINGTNPFTDSSFGTPVTSSNVQTMQFYEDELNPKENTNVEITGGNISFVSVGRYRRTDATVTETKYITYQQMPKIALRLYRSRNITSSTMNPDESFSDALIALANVMNPDGLMFFEFGFERGADGVTHRPVTVPCKTITTTYKRQKTGVTLTGSGWSSSNVEWDTSNVFTDDDPWDLESKDIPTYDQSLELADEKAWCIALESCLTRLKNTNSSKTGLPILYTDEVTPYTTIAKVKGKVIAKINTNNTENESVGIGWSGNTPALFSRWTTGSASKPLTINLQWGRPIVPEPLLESETALRWCFTEQDNVGDTDAGRQTAISLMNGEAYKNYQGGLHRTFYETSLGGYLGGGTATESKCQELAKSLNKYALDKIVNPARNACPLGLVFMNYVIDPNDEYYSKDLIRAIINNNAAFLLNRASGSGGTTTRNDVKENTNSSFVNDNDGLSPLR